MFEVSVSGQFAAQHQLHLPDGGLEPLHEHTWRVQVTYTGRDLDSRGLLVDFTVIRAWLNRLLGTMDHKNLNEVPAFVRRNPSAENVAVFLAEALPADLPGFARLYRVEVEEEPGCIARYFPPAG